MGDWSHRILLISLIFTASYNYSYANSCHVEGTDPFTTGYRAWILDTHNGIFWRNLTTDITRIYSVEHDQNTGNREYVRAEIVDSYFELYTTPLFEQYEEYETSVETYFSVSFQCADNTNTNLMLIVVNVTDTNNNSPYFTQSDGYTFTIFTPVPPGYEITGCLNDITVRDIDLSTYAIDFKIEENPFFEIDFDKDASTTAKEFKAKLRTKEFIRSLPNPLELEVTATDVDRTGDPRRSVKTKITIIANTDFELPEEPVFSETFYLADYTRGNQVVLTEPITLQHGYDKLVQIYIDGDYSTNFELVPDPIYENQRSIRVKTPLEGDVLMKSNIHLIIRADRDLTSGASATVVLRLPEVTPLEFDEAFYEGKIENNRLNVPHLILSQGYEGEIIEVGVRNEYLSSFFTAKVQSNTVTLSMEPLDENIIKDNSFLNIEVYATTGRSSTVTIVTLEIIKDDNVTPVFDSTVYKGTYSSANVLTHDQIQLAQGSDGIEEVVLLGEHRNFFIPKIDGATVTIEVDDNIPPEMYARERIVLTLEVRKSRTVGASAAVIITLPAARELEFEASTYRGILQDGELSLGRIPLTVGYDNGVQFSISGDLKDYFTVTNDQNQAIITLNSEKTIPSDVIKENNIIFLTLIASGLNAITTTTSVLLDIIKDDTTTPVFSSNIYLGTYIGTPDLNIGSIKLAQGFDNSVTFRLDGDHAQYFQISNDSNDVFVVPRPYIPEDVIFKEKVLVFNVLAEKPLTVGARAAISIRFPTELTDPVVMRFAQNTYTGTIDSSGLSVGDIVLNSGYAPGTKFTHTGGLAPHFTLSPPNDDGVVRLSLSGSLSIDTIDDTFIVLEIEASRQGAVSASTSVVIDIVRQEIVSPVFTQPYYRGVYSAEAGLRFNEVIALSDGFDGTVSFDLEGEKRSLFRLVPTAANELTIEVVDSISNEILQANSHLLFTVVAIKPGTPDVHSTISIDIEKDVVVLSFAQNTYTGTLDSSGLSVGDIVLSSGYAPGTEFTHTGDHAPHFTLSPLNNGGVVRLSLSGSLSIDTIDDTFIVLEIEASRQGAVSASTSVVIDIVRQEIVSPVFTQPYYRGVYSAEAGLRFNEVIALSDGFDGTVNFDLEGEKHSLFRLVPTAPNELTIEVVDSISNEILQANSHLLFTVVAIKPGSPDVHSTISIDIEKDIVVLRFAQNTYTGSIDSSGLSVADIVLNSGYAPGTEFTHTGDLAPHFTLSPPNDDGVVRLSLSGSLSIDTIDDTFIVLEIEASRQEAVSASTSVVIDIVRQEIVSPVFTQPYYRGVYSAEAGLRFNEVIALSDGFDGTVNFDLEGEKHSLFRLVPTAVNELTIKVVAPISNDILQANSHLLFTVVAIKPGTPDVYSTISIDIEKDLTDRVILSFAQNTYIGSIDSGGLSVADIVLNSGYAPGTEFTHTGDLAPHFTLSPPNDDGVVRLSLSGSLSIDTIDDTFIVLEIEASRQGAVSASTSVVIDIVRQEIVSPVFTQPYYRGVYSAEAGLRFNEVIALSDGFDGTVNFDLEGEKRSLFRLVPTAVNELTIEVVAPISNDILQANSHLLFTVVAIKPGTPDVYSTISIDIEKDLTDRVILSFAQNTYIGSIDSGGLSVADIVLNSGYAPGTEFTHTGDLAPHFTLSPPNDDGVVRLSLSGSLSIDTIDDTFIVLEIEASRQGAVSASTSVVIDIVRQEIVSPVFTQPYYRGVYSAEAGLRFNEVIALSDGFDGTVNFDLEGEKRSLFRLVPTAVNELTIEVVAPISNDILQANSHLLFTVVAIKPGTPDVYSTISIDIEKDLTDRVILSFAQNTYIGSIDSGGLSVADIVLNSGYAPGTEFTHTGDLAPHFTLSPPNDDGVVRLSLSGSLSIDTIDDTFIVLEIEASRQGAVSASTSVVIDIVRQEIVSPVFTQPYYRGVYSAEAGLRFNEVIALSDGFDGTVNFDLEGEKHSLFRLVPTAVNELTIEVVAPISNDILQANSHLLFTVVAIKPGTPDVYSTISIDIEKDLTDRVILSFAQNTYIGSIDSGGLSVGDIVLNSGYAPGTEFTHTGDLAPHFTLSPPNDDGVVRLSLSGSLSIDTIDDTFVVLEIEASRQGAVSASTSVVIDIVRQEIVSPVFTQPYYRGIYSAEAGLRFNEVIALSDGFDGTVNFDLEGEKHSLFRLVPTAVNELTIEVVAPISNDILQANSHLLFTVVAIKPGTPDVYSTISIDIEKDLTDRVILSFAQNTYIGSIDSGGLSVGDIVLNSGYAPGTEFTHTGDLAPHFTLSPPNDDGVVRLSLSGSLSIDTIDDTFVVLEIEASRQGAVSASTSVVIDIVRQEIVSPVFTQPYYRGIYSAEAGLRFNEVIALSDGFDGTANFDLEGEKHSLFRLVPTAVNELTIEVVAPISNDILQANSHLLFTVVAIKPGTPDVYSTISIDIEKDLTDRVILSFAQNTYIGSIDSGGLSVGDIVLNSGYAPGTEFTHTGDLAPHFTLSPPNDDGVVRLSLSGSLSIDTIDDTFVVLEIEASRQGAVSASTSVVIDIVRQEIVSPVFTQPYYRGIYSAEAGLRFNEVIALSDGFDGTVNFDLEGEKHSLFRLVPTAVNELTIEVVAPISNDILQANSHLLFTVVAIKPGTPDVYSTISIDIEKDLTDRVILSFAQNTYIGSIDSGGLSVGDIVLNSGYAPGTEFTHTGDLAPHFTLSPPNDDGVVRLSLSGSLSIDTIDDTFVVLEIEASRQGAVSASTSVVIDIVRQEIVSPVFTQPYYRGIYSAEAGLRFNEVIALSDGFDGTVNFDLEGEKHSLFRLVPTAVNELTIEVVAPISNDILQANSHLLFTVVAIKPGTPDVYSTISIDIEKDLTDRVILSFAQNTYIGSIDSGGLSVGDIVLNSGYAPGTEFTHTGDLAPHFTLSPPNDDGVVRLSLSGSLSIDTIDDTFVVLEIEASRQGAVSASTSVVIDIVRQEIVSPVFTQPYYRGIYSAEAGLRFNEVIALSDGFDGTVNFDLEGEKRSLFRLVPTAVNELTIEVVAPISNDILQANSHLLFTVVAIKPGTPDVHSTISIDIEKDLTDRVILSFAQNTYIGSIDSGGLSVADIVLNSGYAPGTEFTHTGDLAPHFTLSPPNDDGVVRLSLSGSLSIDTIDDTFIVLEIEASRQGAVSASTSVVIDIVRQEIVSPVFTQPYYRGVYSAEIGLRFNEVIALSDGFDGTVNFDLEGEKRSLFRLVPTAVNELTIEVVAPISNDILQANSHLLFTVVAIKPGTPDVYSTISIDIEKDLTDRVILSFAQNTYTGSIDSSGLSVADIVLNSGYAPGTEFTHTGDLAPHFTLSPPNDDGVVRLSLSGSLSIDTIDDTFIVLEIEASRQGAVSASTSVVIDIVRQEIVSPVFTQPYYRGIYSAEAGLRFNEVIALSDGFDGTVNFDLDGEKRSLFRLVPTAANELTIEVVAPISNDILQANSHLLFTVVAIKPGTPDIYSTISIDIEKDLTDRVILSFAQNTYTGSIDSSGLSVADIVLNSGYAPGTEFTHTGDLAPHFTLSPPNDDGVVRLSLSGSLSIDTIDDTFIVLEIEASRQGAVSASTSVVIDIVRQEIVSPVFTQPYYRGVYSAEAGLRFNEVIALSDGFDGTVNFDLDGEKRSLFRLVPTAANELTIEVVAPISNDILQANSHLLFTVVAIKPGTPDVHSTISIDIEKDLTDRVILSFAQNTYIGSIDSGGLSVADIVLNSGYAPGTEFTHTGDLAPHFTLSPPNDDGVVRLSLSGSLSIDTIDDTFIVLEIEASRQGAVSASTSVVIDIVRQEIVSPVFTQPYYRGVYSAEAGLRFNEVIALSDGFDGTVNFDLEGEKRSLFRLVPTAANELTIEVVAPISNDILQANSHLLFTVVAIKPGTPDVYSTISIDIEKDLTDRVILSFAQNTYTGSIDSSGLSVADIVLNSGYAPGTEFTHTGDLAPHFTLSPPNDDGVVRLSLSGSLSIDTIDDTFIVLEIEASRQGAVSASTSVVIDIVRQEIVSPVFTQPYYRGVYSAEAGLRFNEVIALSDGFDGTVNFDLEREKRSLFRLVPTAANELTIEVVAPISNEILQANSHLLFTVVAIKPGTPDVHSTISIDIEKDLTDRVILRFEQNTYTGYIDSSGLSVADIVLNSGYAPGTEFTHTGDLAPHFTLSPPNDDGVVRLSLSGSLSIDTIDDTFIVLEIEASRQGAVSASTSVVIDIVRQEIVSPVFTHPYYRGVYSAEAGLRFNEVIALSDGFDGTVTFDLEGEKRSLFRLVPTAANELTIEVVAPISNDILQANSHLLFTVVAIKPGTPDVHSTISIDIEKGDTVPSVTFSSSSYVMSVDMAQTGIVGRVSATAHDGEAVTYSLEIDNAHLQTRLSINNEGELYLSAPAASGVYTIEVVAATLTSQAKALVHLKAEAVTDPLIILDRDEEAAHNDLVVLDPTVHAGCHFTLTNHWPIDQTWLYVDESGLHTVAIDREHPSIAFMALSQVQVELVLHCENDNAIHEKHSERTNLLGPYNTSKNKWIFTDTITYNARRSYVNLIVNDINDNYPIFVGKESEPIVVGYPTDELEERILPRSLAELQATDADIGENAALRYSSSESVLAVAPTTGFVHVRSGARLAHDQQLTVTATDMNGQGLSGTITLLVKLLDINHIAVVTVRGAFLDDEQSVLAQLSGAVGYEIKTLRSVVISDDVDGDVTRNSRNTANIRAALQLYVYGINENEPVAVERLTADISSNAAIASVVSTISLEDHLEDINILNNQIGLLVSTIVLGVLLFVVILLVAIWFFLKWRKNRNYNSFDDENSIASRTASLGELPKPEEARPRLNIEDLKKSEKRLQEMLQAPIEKVTVEPMPRKMEAPAEAILDLPIHEPSASIVIQSIDKLKDAEESSDDEYDEFGEVRAKPRKSVVTFNENVEKIIHVEDNMDSNDVDDDYGADEVDDDGNDDIHISPDVDAFNTGHEIYRL